MAGVAESGGVGGAAAGGESSSLPDVDVDPLLSMHVTGSYLPDAPRRPMTDSNEGSVSNLTRFQSTEEAMAELRQMSLDLKRDDWMFAEHAHLLPNTGNQGW